MVIHRLGILVVSAGVENGAFHEDANVLIGLDTWSMSIGGRVGVCLTGEFRTRCLTRLMSSGMGDCPTPDVPLPSDCSMLQFGVWTGGP